MPASNPTTGKCSDRSLRKKQQQSRKVSIVWPQWGVGAHTALLMNAFVGLLLIWPLPYMVSRTFRFIIFICKVKGTISTTIVTIIDTTTFIFAVHIVLFPEDQATLHDESVANRVKHAVPCYHAGGPLLAVGTTCWYTHARFGG